MSWGLPLGAHSPAPRVVVSVGGIVPGIFTAIEASAIAVVYTRYC